MSRRVTMRSVAVMMMRAMSRPGGARSTQGDRKTTHMQQS
jgi:hypothetical protein